MQHHDVIVIGAGPAGTAAAVRAAELGANVAVVEAGRPGGVCTNTGCTPVRVLARTARLVRDAQSAATYGGGWTPPRWTGRRPCNRCAPSSSACTT